MLRQPFRSVLIALGVALWVTSMNVLLPWRGIAAPPLQAVTGTKVQLQPPENFQPAKQFAGFVEASKRATIVVQELPVAFSQARQIFDMPEALQKRGITLLEKEMINVGGKEAILMKVRQNLGETEVLQWLLVLGNDSESVLVKAGFPKENASELSDILKQSLLTTYWDPNATPEKLDLGYTITPQGDLKLALEQREAQIYSLKGEFPQADPKKPLFIVATSVNPVLVLAQADYAEKLLKQLENSGQIKQIQLLKTESIQIDGLSGYVIIAKALDPQSNTPLQVYQVVLFKEESDGTNYYRLLGMVGEERSAEYLPIFQQMSTSFLRQNKPE